MDSDEEDYAHFHDAVGEGDELDVDSLASGLLRAALSKDKTVDSKDTNVDSDTSDGKQPPNGATQAPVDIFANVPTPEEAHEKHGSADVAAAEPFGLGSSASVEPSADNGSHPASSAVGEDKVEDVPDEEKTWPDLTYMDGRVISRRKRSSDEVDELPDEKRSADMANACKEEGNRNFTSGAYTTALACYTEALRFAPKSEEYGHQRAIYYANRAACHLQTGDAEEALYDCDRALEINARYTKALARRMQAMEKLEKLDEALADAQLWADIEPGHQPQANIERIKKLIAERDEKLKEEMMGKLKDMGNWVLGKFGLSVDNFKAVQDPKTGSYSISFQQ